MITLYSTDCPRCHVLEKKLNAAGIQYTINKNVDEMLKMGLLEAPTLEVDGEMMNFKEANDWINKEH